MKYCIKLVNNYIHFNKYIPYIFFCCKRLKYIVLSFRVFFLYNLKRYTDIRMMPFIIENAEITIVTQPTANNVYNFNPRRQELTDLWIDYWVEANTGCNKKKQIIQWNWSCINWKANIPILSKYALHHFLWYSLSSYNIYLRNYQL